MKSSSVAGVADRVRPAARRRSRRAACRCPMPARRSPPCASAGSASPAWRRDGVAAPCSTTSRLRRSALSPRRRVPLRTATSGREPPGDQQPRRRASTRDQHRLLLAQEGPAAACRSAAVAAGTDDHDRPAVEVGAQLRQPGAVQQQRPPHGAGTRWPCARRCRAGWPARPARPVHPLRRPPRRSTSRTSTDERGAVVQGAAVQAQHGAVRGGASTWLTVALEQARPRRRPASAGRGWRTGRR